jgi:UDP-N-acetylglucosamine 1-carboxyvinyltransferase
MVVMTRVIKMEKSKEVFGTVEIPGAKNSALGLVAACCLTTKPVVLTGIPNILDIKNICNIGTGIGLTIDYSDENEMVVDSSKIHTTVLDHKLTSSFRASYYFVGSLLARFKKVEVGYPGGDDFGSRPIDQHIKGLKALGARFLFFNDYYTVEAEELKGADIFFDTITSGATINLIMAASLAKGKTTIHNAATDPEVVDVANMINLMGGKIRGAGTSKITIEGVDELHGCQYQVIPDRLIAGSLLMTVGIAGGKLKLENVIPEHLDSCLNKLCEVGFEFEIDPNSITATCRKDVKGIDIITGMYPGLATDLQQPFTSLLLKIQGKSTVTDTVYPKRFSHVSELKKMGANIKVVGNKAIIQGGIPLHGSTVYAKDVRAGTSLILAAMQAEGVTTIKDIAHIERGYEDAIGIFSQIGVPIWSEEETIQPVLQNVLSN